MGVRSGRGDDGFTDLSFRKNISKDSVDIQAIGDLDELNSYLGLVKSRIRGSGEKAILEKIQQAVTRIASEISIGTEKQKELGLLLKKDDADWIKHLIHRLEEKTRVEPHFYIPGEGEISALLDVARTVSRRAERSIVGLFSKGKVRNGNLLTYMNCISDVLFIMARKKARVEQRVKAKRGKVL